MQRPTMVAVELDGAAGKGPYPHNAPYLITITNNTDIHQRARLKGTMIRCGANDCESILSGSANESNEVSHTMVKRMAGITGLQCPVCKDTATGAFKSDYNPAYDDKEYIGVVHDAQFHPGAVVSAQVAGVYTTMDGRSVVVNNGCAPRSV